MHNYPKLYNKISEHFTGNPLNWNQTLFYSPLHAHAYTLTRTHEHWEASTHVHDLIGCSWEAKQSQLVCWHTEFQRVHMCVYSPRDSAATCCLSRYIFLSRASFRNLGYIHITSISVQFRWTYLDDSHLLLQLTLLHIHTVRHEDIS